MSDDSNVVTPTPEAEVPATPAPEAEVPATDAPPADGAVATPSETPAEGADAVAA